MTKWLTLFSLPVLTLLATGCASSPSSLSFMGKKEAGLSTAQRQLSMARLGERHGQPDTASKIYEKVLSENPNNVEALHRLGVIAARQQNFTQSIELLARAEKNDPNNVEVLNDLGYALYLVDDAAGAEAKLRRALEISPGHKAAHNNLGLVLGQQARWDECLAQFQHAVGNAEAYANLAFVQVQSGELALAEQSFHLALDMDEELEAAAEGLVQLNLKKKLLEKQFMAKYDEFSREQGKQTMMAQIQPTQPDAEAISASRFNEPKAPLEAVEVEVVSHEVETPAEFSSADSELVVGIEDGRQIAAPAPVKHLAAPISTVEIEQPIAEEATKTVPVSESAAAETVPPVVVKTQVPTRPQPASAQIPVVETQGTQRTAPAPVKSIEVQPVSVSPITVAPVQVREIQVEPIQVQPVSVTVPQSLQPKSSTVADAAAGVDRYRRPTASAEATQPASDKPLVIMAGGSVPPTQSTESSISNRKPSVWD